MEAIGDQKVSFRIPESMAKEVRQAMAMAGVWKVSEFARQALALRVREVHEIAAERSNGQRPTRFRRSKREAGR